MTQHFQGDIVELYDMDLEDVDGPAVRSMAVLDDSTGIVSIPFGLWCVHHVCFSLQVWKAWMDELRAAWRCFAVLQDGKAFVITIPIPHTPHCALQSSRSFLDAQACAVKISASGD